MNWKLHASFHVNVQVSMLNDWMESVLGMMELSFPHFSGIISHLQEPETALCLNMCIYNLHITNLPSFINPGCIYSLLFCSIL